MDSGNSGSLQSSSGGGGGGGGDEEFDSRTESISSFLNPSTHFASLTNPNLNPLLQPPPPSSSHQHHPQPTTTNAFFDHSSTSFSHPSNPNPLYNLDSIWSRNLRSDPNFTDFASTENQNQNQTLMGSQQGVYPNPTPVDANTKAGRGPDHHQVGVTTKNPKKRTRASRRAPTTVLTTDTSNFRQMVQEFTGIPAAPFSASSSPFSRRLDLFGGGGGGGGLGPLYPLRPSAQKIQLQTPSFLNSATNIVESGTSNNLTTATTTTVDANSSSSNYQLPPSDVHGYSKQPQNLLNLQNPMFSFQSLLQTTLPQQSNAPVLGTGKSDNQQTNLLSGFPSSSSSSSRWRGQDENLGSFGGGNGNNENVSGYKLNSSDFHHQADKGLENVVVSSRSGGDQVQGNVDSWICPSD